MNLSTISPLVPPHTSYSRWKCIVLLALIFGSIQTIFAGSAAESRQLENLKKLKVGYIPIAECAHLYVGIKNQYFAEEGIEIELVPMRGGAIILPAVQKRDLDIGFANVPSIIGLDSKLSSGSANWFVSVAGATYERPDNCNHSLLIKRGSGIKPADLADPKVAIGLNTMRNIEELMLRRYLEKKGVKAQTLNVVTMGFPDMLPALERGDIKVASVVEPFIEPAIRGEKFERLDKQYLIVSTNTLVATYATTRGWIERNADITPHFLRAFQKADAFIRTNEAQTRQIIGSFTRMRERDLAVIGLPAFGASMEEAPLLELVKEMRRLNFIDKEVEPKSLIYRAESRK